MRSAADRPQTQPQLRECPSCGLFQTVPALAPGMTAQCVRCPTTLRRTSSHRLDHIIALTVAAFVLLVVMCTTNLMSVETSGIKRTADLFSGPQELVRQDMAPLGAVVVFVTVLAPLVRLVGTLYVLIRVHERRPPRHLRRVFALAERLRPWSMIEVFVFGVFVAYVKLGDLVTIGLLTGVYALLALTFVLVWMDSALDREAVWERLDHDNLSGGSRELDGCRRLRDLRSGQCPRVRRRTLPALRKCTARAQAEQHRAHLGIGHRRRDFLHPGELLSGAVGGAARRRPAEHDPRRRRGAGEGAASTRSRYSCSSPASRCRC